MTDWLARLLAGHRGTLARAITAVENNTAECDAILAGVRPHLGRAMVVGFTGPPGAGKSTLVSAVMAELRKRDRTVGVVAVDPSSMVSGGAILGDRIRMGAHAGDPAIFVRSIAARGQLGGLARMTAGIVDLMDSAGKDVVIVETVGAGQSEIEVAGLAQCCVVVLPPGLGDDVQAIKAGILEIADVLVVTKNDLPGADLTARQLTDRARMNKRRTPVLRVAAPRDEGIAALVDAIDAHAAQAGRTHVAARTTRMLIELALAEARARLVRDADGALARLSAEVQAGRLRLSEAAAQALDLVASTQRRDPHPNPLPQAGEGAGEADSSGTLSRLRERVG